MHLNNHYTLQFNAPASWSPSLPSVLNVCSPVLARCLRTGYSARHQIALLACLQRSSGSTSQHQHHTIWDIKSGGNLPLITCWRTALVSDSLDAMRYFGPQDTKSLGFAVVAANLYRIVKSAFLTSHQDKYTNEFTLALSNVHDIELFACTVSTALGCASASQLLILSRSDFSKGIMRP